MVDTPPAPANIRRHKGLVTFLGRQESLRFDDLDFSHPILAGSTMAELREAMDEIARKANDDLSATYGHWMGTADTMSIGADQKTDWMEVSKLRYHRIQHRMIIAGRAAIVWSPADIWLLHFFPLAGTSHRKVFYAVQSVISKEPATYAMISEAMRRGTGFHRRSTLPVRGEARLPPRRNIASALNEQLGQLMESLAGPDIVTTDPDYPLHRYIQQNFR